MTLKSLLYALPLLAALMQSACAEEKPLLPSHRIVAYYGNFESPHMGILGEYPPDEVLSKLQNEVDKWAKADPKTPVIPAIHYIAVVAQHDPGKDELYRLRMPHDQIQKAIDLAAKINGLVILDVQIGRSNVKAEIAHLEPYLSLPNVMLALDPEFSMDSDLVPGEKIGTMDASQINIAIDYLADLVKQKNLPPKFLVVHRFTHHMVTNYQDIRPQPEVQVIMDMDGFGPQALKRDSYKAYIAADPVQFTGFKIFYHQDLREEGTTLYTPEQLLKFKPVPIYILYQ